ncbi:LysR family transcriptional regulator [Auraticoccus sp. F435]|uniref:LysR family transcriptional regulator n=1 Tax=Auraticoccus cholistanensis TaxID=2656650 RepID=A0A6A9UUM6_9ACTN|nr:LysR family transcriptional regulator [Auraticoccus cholistanensis]MVA75445.1 LysR family transcriptional regulator [Auraticoccus cholistanensis]
MVDVSRLRAFRAVVATGSVQAAAVSLGYTPSAVSQQIAALQRETGLALFEKSGRGIVPTPAGELLAAESDAVMGQLAHLDGVVQDLAAGRSGQLTIRSFPSTGEAWLPEVVRRLLEERPEVSVRVDLSDMVTPADLDSADITIHTDATGDARPGVPGVPGRRRVELARERYFAVVATDHPLADRSAVSMAELVEHPWVQEDLGETVCGEILQRAWRQVGRTPHIVARTSGHHSAIAFAAAGIGLFVGPYLTVARLGPQVRVLAITDPAPQRLDVASVRRTSERNPATRRALELLAETARDDVGLHELVH